MIGYIPRKGDFISISLDPQSGHEQKGRRPALVVSTNLFNEKTGMAFICPITNTNRGFPFQVVIPAGFKINGVAMVDQVKSVDFKSRRAAFIDRAPDSLLSEVLGLLEAILD